MSHPCATDIRNCQIVAGANPTNAALPNQILASHSHPHAIFSPSPIHLPSPPPAVHPPAAALLPARARLLGSMRQLRPRPWSLRATDPIQIPPPPLCSHCELSSRSAFPASMRQPSSHPGGGPCRRRLSTGGGGWRPDLDAVGHGRSQADARLQEMEDLLDLDLTQRARYPSHLLYRDGSHKFNQSMYRLSVVYQVAYAIRWYVIITYLRLLRWLNRIWYIDIFSFFLNFSRVSHHLLGPSKKEWKVLEISKGREIQYK
jgi:hypothetical protein